MVRLAPKKDGAIAWHDLVLEYEPPLAVRWCAQLAELLTPDWTGRSNQEFPEALMTWEPLGAAGLRVRGCDRLAHA